MGANKILLNRQTIDKVNLSMSLKKFSCPSCGNNAITLGSKSRSGLFTPIKCPTCSTSLKLHPWFNNIYLLIESVIMLLMVVWAFFHYSWVSWLIVIVIFVVFEIGRAYIVPLVKADKP